MKTEFAHLFSTLIEVTTQLASEDGLTELQMLNLNDSSISLANPNTSTLLMNLCKKTHQLQKLEINGLRDVNEEGTMIEIRKALLLMTAKIFETSTCLSEICLRDIGGE